MHNHTMKTDLICVADNRQYWQTLLVIKHNTVNLTVFCCSLQLEEANRTLTSDVANLANEKEELNNKLKDAVEGN